MFYSGKNNFYNKYFKELKEIPLYYINLDRSEDRLIPLEKNIIENNNLLKSKNIRFKPTRIPAIDGINIKEYNYLFDDENYICENTDYEVACCCSHLLAIKKAHACNEDMIIICEDDIDLEYFYSNYDIFIENLKFIDGNYEIIQGFVINDLIQHKSFNLISNFVNWVCNFTSPSPSYNTEKSRSNFWGCQLYIITKEGISKIVNKYFKNNKIIVDEKNFLSDNIIYRSCETITSNIPLCTIRDNIFSLIHNEHLKIHKIAIEDMKLLNEYQLNLKNFKNDVLASYDNTILKGDYLIFTSLGDNSLNAYEKWLDWIQQSNLKIDLVIYYYGKNEYFYNNLKTKNLVIEKSKGIKFDNLYNFYWKYKLNLDRSNYKRVAVFDDDLILETDEGNPIEKLFSISEKISCYISGPSCRANNLEIINILEKKIEIFQNKKNEHLKYTENDLEKLKQEKIKILDTNNIKVLEENKSHVVSWFFNTWKIKNKSFHYTNYIETNSPIFRFDCLHYLMLHYRYKEIPSWGSDLFYIQLFGKDLQNKYAIIDEVYYINQDMEKKNILVREIDLSGMNEKQEEEKWINFAKKYKLLHELEEKIYDSV